MPKYKYTPWTRENFKRAARKTKGLNPMIPYYYRNKYGVPRNPRK